MQKDFQKWHSVKTDLQEQKSNVFFHEREIWWCAAGVNLGFEQDGSGERFLRPVVVIKKFNLDACIAVPLTARQKKGKYYFPVGNIEEKEAVAILSQLRFIDRKRLAQKAGVLDEEIFKKLINAIVKMFSPAP